MSQVAGVYINPQEGVIKLQENGMFVVFAGFRRGFNAHGRYYVEDGCFVILVQSYHEPLLIEGDFLVENTVWGEEIRYKKEGPQHE